MAYSTDNPPLLVATQPITGHKQWVYVSTHLATNIGSSIHLTNAKDLGMQVGDMVINIGTNASGVNSATAGILMTSHFVTRVAATSCNMSTGVVLGGTT